MVNKLDVLARSKETGLARVLMDFNNVELAPTLCPV